MTKRRHELLVSLVRAEDAGEVPLAARECAAALDADPAPVREDLDRLAAMELVAATDDGYRPTITGRELLELDLDGEAVVVDAAEDSTDQNHRYP